MTHSEIKSIGGVPTLTVDGKAIPQSCISMYAVNIISAFKLIFPIVKMS